MCLYNEDIKELNKLRAKGHVLRKGYKCIVYHPRDNEFKSYYNRCMYQQGWNRAKNESGHFIQKRVPYIKGHPVYDGGFHVCLTKEGAETWSDDSFNERQIIMPFWFYCDEVTGYEINPEHTITVSRVLIKKFPKIKTCNPE